MNDKQYIYGINPAIELLRAGKRKIFRVLVSKPGRAPRFGEITGSAAKLDVPVLTVSDGELDALAKGGNHQGVALEVEVPQMLSLDEALAAEKDFKNAVWIGVDGITDPMNLGAMLRSAACLGASAAVLPERRTAGLTPTVQKTASGAVESLNIVSVVNLNQTILTLKKKGFWIYGADMKGKPLNEAKFSGAVFLIIGSEGEGLHQKTMEHCDELVCVPQKGGVESMNASAACAVILYEILRQKKP
ncbi:MAG: 23S rRNA (guanosine(2251)-2'-O)-methyltransferase RlmB [bacterium]